MNVMGALAAGVIGNAWAVVYYSYYFENKRPAQSVSR